LDGYAAFPFDGRLQSPIVELRLGKRRRPTKSFSRALVFRRLLQFAAERAVNRLRRFLPSFLFWLLLASPPMQTFCCGLLVGSTNLLQEAAKIKSK
jgi:hypothetical protein